MTLACPDCSFEIVDCNICGGLRCECRPVDADCRYVHWRNGEQVQVSVQAMRRRATQRQIAATAAAVRVEHRMSLFHRRKCGVGIEERAS